MLKSETLNIIEFNNGQSKKPVLIRYTIVINSKESQPYDEDALKFISFLKSLPDDFKTVELYYEYYVEGDEQSVSPSRLEQALKAYQI